MPPSPAFKSSPGRRLRVDNHRRGHSLESGLLLKEKDEDLALFNGMQSRERDNFLLHPVDDFDVFFSTKLRYFSDFKLGISIPVRGQSSDLLNADGEKNDYDWLLTPPDTPLFPSLDDETPPVNLAHRGRPRSQPIPISRSTTIEKSYSTSRSSASPHRLSPSPRSGNSTFQSRGRPSSAPHSSPSPSLRFATPSRRPSPPPNRPLTPAPRSPTPTAQSMSTGSSATVASSGRRGTSPVNTSRGNSASPKLRAWQSNLPGFSSDTPPNLRTSLADRPASYVRGLSPASRKSRDSSSKFGGQSMSPTASRSAGSSYSHDQDQFSPHSRGSVASSGDDDIDSLQSVSVGTSDCSAPRKVGTFPNSRVLVFSKKPARTLSSNSVPKRSFDSALRQMEHRRSPQNMFRPLLSSVPSTTFYVGKENSAHHLLISRNSSVTTSSNASSEQGASVAPDIEESDHNQDDMANEWGMAPYPDAQDEVFVFDKVEEVNEDVEHGIHNESPKVGPGDFDEGTKIEVELGKSEEFCNHNTATATYVTGSEYLYVEGDSSEVACHENMASCSKCGNKFRVIKRVEGNDDLCPNCCEKDECLTVAAPQATIIVIQNGPFQSEMTMGENSPVDEFDPVICVPELPETANSNEARLIHNGKDVEQCQSFNTEQSYSCSPGNSFARSVEEGEKSHVDQLAQLGKDVEQCRSFNAEQSYSCLPGNSLARSVMDEGEKNPVDQLAQHGKDVEQCQSFNAEQSYSCLPGNSLARSAMEEGEKSPVDQLAQHGKDVEQCQSFNTEQSYSGLQGNSVARSVMEEGEKSPVDQLAQHGKDVEQCRSFNADQNYSCLPGNFLARSVMEEGEKSPVDQHVVDQPIVASSLSDSDTADQQLPHFNAHPSLKVDVSEGAGISVLLKRSSSSKGPVVQGRAFTATNIHYDDPSYARDITNDMRSSIGHGSSSASCSADLNSSEQTEILLNSSLDGIYVVEGPTHGSLVAVSGELENGHESTSSSQSGGAVSPNSKSIIHELQKPTVATLSEKHISVSARESNISDHGNGILDESTVTIEGLGGNKARSLALEEEATEGLRGNRARSMVLEEEATDTILFCSSIVHDLIYQAATIGMENEKSVLLEGSWPMVTILGKSSSGRKDPHGRTASKRTPKSQKARQRRVEKEMKAPSTKTDTEIKTNESLTHDAGVMNKVESKGPPQELESKCNCTVM
ncbi:hypothetical protein HHK36_015771 [Tetracentron sinense]|uniref:Uncharacterized protein n=1 Tax=Tetracentron sinense TaxID=13715 RepID=A0A835DE75_TETSI|nr:hypothetical protein HHK36_015771 [Tetracentron sinense]